MGLEWTAQNSEDFEGQGNRNQNSLGQNMGHLVGSRGWTCRTALYAICFHWLSVDQEGKGLRSSQVDHRSEETTARKNNVIRNREENVRRERISITAHDYAEEWSY